MSEDTTTAADIQPAEDSDAADLARLGYKQELHRGMSGFSNFAVSFSIISILAGCITSYSIALNSGGPSAITLGWPIVGVFVLCVALAMAEVCSRYPTAGGLYFWAGRLAKKNKRQWAWFVGWFNFLGEVAVTAAIDYGAAITMMAFASLTWGVQPNAYNTFGLFLVLIVIHGLLNTFGVNLVSLLSNISAWWHIVGVLIIVGAL
ncbi:MAG: amino acid permease, partial [Actinomycetales bacterium]